MTLCNLYFYKLIHFNFIFRFIVSFLSWQFLSPFEKSSIHVLLYIRVYIFKLNTDKGNVEVKMDFNVKTQEKITRFQNAHVSLLCSPVIKNSPCVYVFLSYSLNRILFIYSLTRIGAQNNLYGLWFTIFACKIKKRFVERSSEVLGNQTLFKRRFNHRNWNFLREIRMYITKERETSCLPVLSHLESTDLGYKSRTCESRQWQNNRIVGIVKALINY